MIINMKPLHLAEVKDLAGDLESKPELKEYIKEFSKLDKKQADALAEALRNMGNAKIREDAIVKIVDLLPRDSESIAKIFTDITLDEKETNEILAVVKEY